VLDSDGRPLWFTWTYTRAELIADGVVHAIGVTFGLIGAIAIAVLTLSMNREVQIASALIYAGGLLCLLGFSAAYNMWPVTPRKWLLRRFDHAAIYLLIAATYTPFLLDMKAGAGARGLFVAIWATAICGIAVKLFLPGRFDRLATALYLLLGWSGVLLYESIFATLPGSTVTLLATGGVLYSVGVVFHAWQSLRFQNAIWHAFVLAAALCHYFAVLETVT